MGVPPVRKLIGSWWCRQQCTGSCAQPSGPLLAVSLGPIKAGKQRRSALFLSVWPQLRTSVLDVSRGAISMPLSYILFNYLYTLTLL